MAFNQKEYMKKYYKKNKERLRKMHREYLKEYEQRIEVKKRRQKYFKKHYLKNKKRIREYQREYEQRPTTKVKRKIYLEKYNQENGVRIKERERKYWQGPEYKKRKKEYCQRPETKQRRREYYLKNKDKWEVLALSHKSEEYKKRRREDYQKNKKRIRERSKKYRPRINNYKREKYKTDKDYKIIENLRNRLNMGLKHFIKTGKIMPSKEYGIDYKLIINHLKPFPENLQDYEIHHIKPLFTFNFINDDGSTNLGEVGKAFAPENHILLTKEEHRKLNHRKLGV